MARINGKDNPAADNMTISDFLLQNGYRSEIVAVEYNQQILARSDYDKQKIDSAAVIEIVSFMGGGQPSDNKY